MQIHRLVLKRIDGSETRRNFVAVSADAPRIGAMIQLAIDRHIRVQARVTALQTITFGSRDGRQGTIELTVRAQEVMFVPVADNDP